MCCLHREEIHDANFGKHHLVETCKYRKKRGKKQMGNAENPSGTL